MLERALVKQPDAVCAERDFVAAFACLLSPRWRYRLLGAGLAWFLMDFAYYGNTVSSPLVLAAIAPQADLLTHVLTQLKVFLLAAVPGYVIAAIMMDRMGRKAIRTLGFIVMAITFGILALYPNIQREMLPFLLIYGASYLFTEFGPNATTFVYPSEIFPTGARTTGHGIAAAMGKLGAFIGVFFFPILLRVHGLSGAELAAAIVSLIGAGVTVPLLPNTKGKTLEELNEAAPDRERARTRSVAASAAR